MKQGKKLLLLAVFGALVIPMLFAGTASAKYVGDNAVPDGAGGWALPEDKGFCVSGIKRDGTMIMNLSVGNNRNDCFAATFPAYTTSAACLAADKAGADAEGSHFWSSACVNPADNTGISLSGLDRTRYMCEQKGGVYKLFCNSSWVAMGPAWSAAPVSPTTGGTEGFCYTSMRVTGYDNAVPGGLPDCPYPVAGTPGTGKLGYSWGTARTVAGGTDFTCRYTYGVVGAAATRLSYKDGQGIYADNAAVVNLTGLTQGQCLAIGASFANHTTAGGFGADPVDASVTIATPITSVRAGCLSCHNNTTQYNSASGRWKSDYLKQGHKNMLRKVTAGSPWAGPNADGVIEVYTTAAVPTGATAGDYQVLNFTTAEATTTFWGTRPLMYLFGDWMAPAPDALDTVVWRADLAGARYNGTSTYSCAACHSTGWSNPTAGICVVSGVAKTSTQVPNSGACATALGTWYPMSGDQSSYAWPASGAYLGTYVPAEPGASFPAYAAADNSIPGITGRWDFDSITCNRCHLVSYDPTFPINDQGVHAAPGHTTHETDIFDGWACVKTCFSCHQSPPYTNNGLGLGGQNEADLAGFATNLQVKNVATAPAYKPEFNSHIIGNSFLNSPHGKSTGVTTLPNRRGKYDLATATNTTTFVGKLCRSSTAAGGGSIMETMSDGEIIKTLEDCNRANGKPNVPAPYTPDSTSYGFWQNEGGDGATGFEGSCITCHNVHESLFVADAKEPLRRECTTCHVGNAGGYESVPKVTYGGWGFINHPDSALTPVGIANAAGVPAKACESCHMPKATSAGFPMHLWRVNSSATYSTFPTAAEFGIPGPATKKIANTSADGAYTNAVWVDVDYACGQCHGGGPNEANPVYAVADRVVAGAMYYPKATLAAFAAGVHDGTYPPISTNVAPVAVFTVAFDPNTWVATLNNTTTDDHLPSVTYAVNWGDSNSNNYTAATIGAATHTYNVAGTFPITLKAVDNAALFSTATNPVTAATFSIPVTVTAGPAGSATANSVLLTLKRGTNAIANYTTPASGTGPFSYSFTGLKPGTNYSVNAYKYQAVFTPTPPTTAITVGPDASTVSFTTVQAKFKITSTAKGSGGANLPNVTITVKNTVTNQLMAQGTTNASGVYATNMTLPAGTYTVTAYKSGRLFTGSSPQSVTVGPADGTLTFTSTTP